MQVKICGIRRPEDVHACLEAGADLVGLNFAPRSKRCLDIQTGRRLAALLPPCVGVAVLQDASLEQAQEILSVTGLPVVQLHGAAPDAMLDALRRTTQIIRAVPGDAVRVVGQSASRVDAFLLDGPKPGSGTPWRWASQQGEPLAGRPIFVAGGLTPGNVGDAIRALRPAGVDVASGVEGPDGQIDPQRVRAFIAAVRDAAASIRSEVR